MGSNQEAAPKQDVIVMGGGPAGSTTATLLAQKGLRVLLLEKSRFPRFHIGESLMPETYWPLKRLGVLDKMKASAFPRKHSVQFVSTSGKESHPFYFSETNPHESSVTWQVLRSQFDEMLLNNAREHGVDVREEMNVEEVLFEGSQAVGVVARPRGGKTENHYAKVIVDATGLNAFLSKKLKIRNPDPRLKKVAIFAHFEGGRRDPGIDEGATLVLHTPDGEGWFWYIPLPENRVSAGIVGPPEKLFARPGQAEATLNESIEQCAGVRHRLESAKRVSEIYTTSDFSFQSTRCAGDGWVLVGDAYSFLDPIYSSGVFLALKSGELAADTIGEAFEKGDFSAGQLSRFGSTLSTGMKAIRRLIYAFYTREFHFGRFVRKFPQHRKRMIDILVGNVFTDNMSDLFESLEQMCPLPEMLPPEDKKISAVEVRRNQAS
ncbi:MAG: NAD(P)/FAD-dependent oxidoreductase [Acidobacteria bacterium]|nr:NAD(P)/FAD-dependent oxidoreductase [Acidobacteriota bacterium]